jgi:hypothetical protein
VGIYGCRHSYNIELYTNIYKSDPDKTRQMLTNLINNHAEKVLSETVV